MAISKQELQINEEIRDREVLVIDAEGVKRGVMSARDAQMLAFEQDLDLVKIAPQATPPVCRIMDYRKYCFEQQKREKEARKNQRIVEIKEIRMFSAIEKHDFERLVSQGKKFLQGGDKIKVSVRFRKRAIAHPELGRELLERYRDMLADAAVVDKPPKMEGRAYVMFMSPKLTKPEKAEKSAKVKKPAAEPEAVPAAAPETAAAEPTAEA
ncbi:MAG: translation initiation factor IF-3 [Oscillospiraceae bacterium]|nr:translation initiation factor IF-3 [Oscillospiraceae bacterium]